MIVITTPTGMVGRQVLARVLESGQRVRVVARDASRLPPGIGGRVEVVEGSHGDGAVAARAFAGADSVFWLPPPDPRAASPEAALVDFSRPACAVFRSGAVGRVVGVSALGHGVPMRAGLVSASLAMDEMIGATGVAYRALVMPSFMDNLLRQVEGIRERGVFVGAVAGDRRAPTCAVRDIAAVAARLLLDPSWGGPSRAGASGGGASGGGASGVGPWSGVRRVPVLGPEDLSFDEMAGIMSGVLGRPVRYERISDEAFRAGLIARGTSEGMADGILEMMRAKDAGLDNAEPRTPEASTPTGFRQWCEEVLRPAVLG